MFMFEIENGSVNRFRQIPIDFVLYTHVDSSMLLASCPSQGLILHVADYEMYKLL